MPNDIKTFFKASEDDGRLLSTIHVTPEEAARQGNCFEDEPPYACFDEGFWPHRGPAGWERRARAAPPAPSYAEQRASAYPSLEEQLGLLWHAMNNGEIPVASLFYQVIKDIKDQYPKPAGVGTEDVALVMPEA